MGNENNVNEDDFLVKQNLYYYLGMNPDKIKKINDNYYLDLKREEYKLNKEILRNFERNNNFSRDKSSK